VPNPSPRQPQLRRRSRLVGEAVYRSPRDVANALDINSRHRRLCLTRSSNTCGGIGLADAGLKRSAPNDRNGYNFEAIIIPHAWKDGPKFRSNESWRACGGADARLDLRSVRRLSDRCTIVAPELAIALLHPLRFRPPMPRPSQAGQHGALPDTRPSMRTLCDRTVAVIVIGHTVVEAV
jgi:hypothetical protein